uniref:Secreted protein n=1 Tax=Romanomermis culicivorax TaxID=13658 RepID=A0A915J492_ROMCU
MLCTWTTFLLIYRTDCTSIILKRSLVYLLMIAASLERTLCFKQWKNVRRLTPEKQIWKPKGNNAPVIRTTFAKEGRVDLVSEAIITLSSLEFQ